ncbi:hypothetical protein ACAX61_02850 [Sphingomonas sp. IW22]
MRLAKILATAAMVSATAAPAIAADSASKLSVAKTVRASTASEEANKAVGTGAIVGVVAAAAVIGGIIIATDGDDDDSDSN